MDPDSHHFKEITNNQKPVVASKEMPNNKKPAAETTKRY